MTAVTIKAWPRMPKSKNQLSTSGARQSISIPSIRMKEMMMNHAVLPMDVLTTLILVIIAAIRFWRYRKMQWGVKTSGINTQSRITPAVNIKNWLITGLIMVTSPRINKTGMLRSSTIASRNKGRSMICKKVLRKVTFSLLPGDCTICPEILEK